MADKFTQQIMYSAQTAQNKLNDKFKVSNRIAWRIGNEIIPVTLLEEFGLDTGRTVTVNLQTGIGYFISATDIPDDEEWQVKLVVKPTTTAAASLQILVNGSVACDLTASDTNLTVVTHTGVADIRMVKGDIMQVTQTSNAGDAARVINGIIARRKIKG